MSLSAPDMQSGAKKPRVITVESQAACSVPSQNSATFGKNGRPLILAIAAMKL